MEDTMYCRFCGTEFNGNFCPSCGAQSAQPAGTPQQNQNVTQQQVFSNQASPSRAPKANKPFYSKWWFWVIIGVVVLGIIGGISGKNKSSDSKEGTLINDTTNNVVDNKTPLPDNVALAPDSAVLLIDKNVEDVVALFANAGFKEIKTEGKGDLIVALLHSEGDVETISVGGNTMFSKGDVFDQSTQVIIRYHSYNKTEEIVLSNTTPTPEPTVNITEAPTLVTTAETTPASTATPSPKPTATPTPTPKPTNNAVSYSTNDLATAKKGNTGVFSYRSRGGSYYIYYIIDFDKGYVYRFCEGNGDTIYDRALIESGDLNNTLVMKYTDGNDSWRYGLHFSWKNQPDHLVVEDERGYSSDFYTTNLNDALELMGRKTMCDYAGSTVSKTNKPTQNATSTPKPTATPKPTSTETKSQSNARKSAESYLRFSAFSRERLIDQLEFEGYSHSDAEYGADHCGADWNEQAKKSAKSYIDFSAFSFERLVDQLIYEKYTEEQAEYGAKNCGADWKEQAKKSAKSYLDSSAFSYSGLMDQLIYEKFTEEQAKYGVQNCGADWNEQAKRCAKKYLDFAPFSREELIEQLLYEGFTYDQAEYGVSANGL